MNQLTIFGHYLMSLARGEICLQLVEVVGRDDIPAHVRN